MLSVENVSLQVHLTQHILEDNAKDILILSDNLILIT